jgi:hypothetical protein
MIAMLRLTYDPALIGDGERFIALIIGPHPRLEMTALAQVKTECTGPVFLEDFAGLEFGGFEARAGDAFERAKILAMRSSIFWMLVIDPNGMLPKNLKHQIH